MLASKLYEPPMHRGNRAGWAPHHERNLVDHAGFGVNQLVRNKQRVDAVKLDIVEGVYPKFGRARQPLDLGDMLWGHSVVPLPSESYTRWNHAQHSTFAVVPAWLNRSRNKNSVRDGINTQAAS